jgi:hypothetical protein
MPMDRSSVSNKKKTKRHTAADFRAAAIGHVPQQTIDPNILLVALSQSVAAERQVAAERMSAERRAEACLLSAERQVAAERAERRDANSSDRAERGDARSAVQHAQAMERQQLAQSSQAERAEIKSASARDFQLVLFAQSHQQNAFNDVDNTEYTE